MSSRCCACDSILYDIDFIIDDTGELCKKCYAIDRQYLREITNDESIKGNKNEKKNI